MIQSRPATKICFPPGTTQVTVPGMTSAERTVEAITTRDFTGVALSTPRLTLREFRETDIDAITEACQDEEIRRYTMVPAPYERANAEKFVREICPAGRAAGTDVVFGVFVTGTGTLVGAIGLHNISHLDEAAGGSAGIGYWTAPWSRRRGYTSESVAEVCRWGVRELRLALIRWDAIVGNDGSWKVAQRSGFVLEGTRRSYLVYRGARKDLWVGSLLASEFADQDMNNR
jgi:RimJ/RimL family protein N-acetyltransferase